jgi:CHAT domain-containing protein
LRTRFGIFAPLLVALCSVACRSPESEYKTLKQEVDRGEFRTTLVGTDTALKRYTGRNTDWEWRFRLLKARILVSRSEADEALSILGPEPPSALSRTEIPEQRKLYQGIAHRYKQQFDDAERDFEEAERLAEPLVPSYPCQLLIARAALWVDEKKYDLAQTDYNNALTFARRHSVTICEANALADLARLTTSQNHFDRALDLYLAALKLAQSLEMNGNAATILGNMGWSYFELGDFEASLDFYGRGAQASEKSGLQGYSGYWFSGVANSYLALREYTLAENLAQATLKHARDLKDAETETICLNTLTEVLLRKGQFAEAERYNREALKMEEEGLDKLGTPASLVLTGEVAAAEKRFDDAEQLFHRVLSLPSLETPLRWQAESGLAGVRDGEGKPVDAERLYLQAIDTIEKARQSINHDELRLSFLSSGIAVYGKYIDFLVRHSRPADALNQAELSRARTLAEGLSSDVKSSSRTKPGVSPQALAQRLQATLLVYWLGEEHSYLWAITPAKTSYFMLPPASEIDPLVKTYTKAIVDSKDVLATDDRLTGEKLYATLIAPAQKFIPANSRVILLPDVTLYGLNFETLIAPTPEPHYWIEDVTLTTGSSLTLLTSSANRTAAKEKNLLLVGNPKEANPEFPPLLQAPNEMMKVEQHFPEPQRVVLEGERATPISYLSSHPERFFYVHFATHGTASRTRPLESAVVLSKEPDGDTYKLYARDIVTRHLQAELVTISACYGSGRRAYSGEGLVGLSWAFVRAGAHKVIGALWEVSDVPATPELMDALYRELGMGKDPASALRSAKLSLLHSTNPNTVFRKPFYWAPFQLYAGS